MKKILFLMLLPATLFAESSNSPAQPPHRKEFIFCSDNGTIVQWSLDFIPNAWTNDRYDTATFEDAIEKPTNTNQLTKMTKHNRPKIRKDMEQAAIDRIVQANTEHAYMLEAQSNIVAIASAYGVTNLPLPMKETRSAMDSAMKAAKAAKNRDLQDQIQENINDMLALYNFYRDNGGEGWNVGLME